MRTVQRYNLETNEWEDIKFEQLRKGDIFQLFDNGIQVEDDAGYTRFQAISDAYLNDDDIYTVDIMSSINEE